MFAKTCESVLKNKEEVKKNLMDKYGKSWDELVNLAKESRLRKLYRKTPRVIQEEQRVRDIVYCEHDPYYLDD